MTLFKRRNGKSREDLTETCKKKKKRGGVFCPVRLLECEEIKSAARKKRGVHRR